MSEASFSYDEVPYSSFTFPQTRPDRLATLAVLYGMEPAAPEKCRVLELGCGDGTNLLSFAQILPDSRFVGIDLSKVHIELANQAAEELELRNLEFRCDDVMNAGRDTLGEFDYIIAHGLFSWVPDAVRTKILELYADCLAPHGVGYISYNTYPGCKIREMVWDMMKFYTAPIDAPMEKVARGVQFVNFLSQAADPDSRYATIITTELSQFAQRTAENIYHDDFSSLNRPFYFHEFADLLATRDLQFLSEADAHWTDSGVRPEVAAKLDELGNDVIRREQYIDFVKGRPFRSSLICRKSVKPDRDPGPSILRSFYLASQVEPASAEPDLTSAAAERFKSIEGGEAEVSTPLVKAALFILQRAWSGSVEFDALMRAAAELSGAGEAADIEAASAELFALFKRGLVYLHRFQPKFPNTAGKKPRTSKFVQWQIRRKCSHLTALSGMDMKPDGDLMLLLLLLCDGIRSREDLVKELEWRITFPEAEKEESLARLPGLVEDRLSEFARLGLFEA